jgi:hypothetical protein
MLNTLRVSCGRTVESACKSCVSMPSFYTTTSLQKLGLWVSTGVSTRLFRGFYTLTIPHLPLLVVELYSSSTGSTTSTKYLYSFSNSRSLL